MTKYKKWYRSLIINKFVVNTRVVKSKHLFQLFSLYKLQIDSVSSVSLCISKTKFRLSLLETSQWRFYLGKLRRKLCHSVSYRISVLPLVPHCIFFWFSYKSFFFHNFRLFVLFCHTNIYHVLSQQMYSGSCQQFGTAQLTFLFRNLVSKIVL